jgi:hypothetical protein
MTDILGFGLAWYNIMMYLGLLGVIIFYMIYRRSQQ